MKEVKLMAECPNCDEKITLTTELDAKQLAPDLRCKELKPVESVFIYRVTTDEIKSFIIQKVSKMVPDAKIEVVPIYCEKKKRKETEVHHSYAALKIAFSEHIVEKKEDLGWYGKIGESGNVPRVKKSLFTEIIKKYQYDSKELDKWMKNYKILEELEDGLGMTEPFINDIRKYCVPQRVPTGQNEDWIFFSAAPERVFQDMFTDPETNKVAGKIHIHDVYPISKDVVEFEIYLHPEVIDYKDNPHVRQILQGELKVKK